MKKLIMLLIFLFALGIFVQNADAITYTLTGYPGKPAWPGGPFLINGSIITYCLERDELLILNTPYEGTIDDYSIQGARLGNYGGGPDSDPPKDYLDFWTEWLIANYLYDSLTSQNKMMDFQNAIWRIEGEYFGGPYPAVLAFDYYATVAAVNPQTGVASIKVLNLFEYDVTGQIVHRQSVIITPEPGTLLLLGAGLLGVGYLARRKRFPR